MCSTVSKIYISSKFSLTLDRARTNQSPSYGSHHIGRGCSMVDSKIPHTLTSANQNCIFIAGLLRKTLYIEPARAKTPYTLTVRHENSAYIEPSLSRNDIVISAKKISTVKRNDTGLQPESQKCNFNII